MAARSSSPGRPPSLPNRGRAARGVSILVQPQWKVVLRVREGQNLTPPRGVIGLTGMAAT